MPTEVFQLILPHLNDIYTLLALEFVSKTINAMTKLENGKPVVDARKGNLWLPSGLERACHQCIYWLATIRLENNDLSRKNLTLLTCVECGVRKPNGWNGFLDRDFYPNGWNGVLDPDFYTKDDALDLRVCIECRESQSRYTSLGIPNFSKICGLDVLRCDTCKRCVLSPCIQ